MKKNVSCALYAKLAIAILGSCYAVAAKELLNGC